MIIIPIIAGIFLRIFQIRNNYLFTGELGKELLYTLQYMKVGSFPLVGMPTSHEWLNYGPIYYWILIPLMKIFGGSPYLLFWVAFVVASFGSVITYFIFKKIVNQKFAVILISFISVSPLWVWATRLSKLHTFFFILTPLVVFFMYKIWSGYKKYMLWLGLAFGTIFSFHFSQIPIFIVIFLMLYLKRKHFMFKDYFLFLLGLIIPNLTVFIYDFKNGFEMIKNLTLWIPYRFAMFIGIYPKKGLNALNETETLASFNEFFGRNIFEDHRFWILGTVIFWVLFTIFVVQNRRKITKDFFVFFLISSTVVQCASLLIHSNPPLHYFFPIFLNFGLLFSYYASRYWIWKFSKTLIITIFVSLFVIGILKIKNEHLNDIGYVPLAIQEVVVRSIIDDAKSQAFQLSRIGPFDYFPENYNQNYKYLILIEGGDVDSKSNLIYTIVEGESNIPKDPGMLVFSEKDVYVYKNNL